LAIVEFKAAVIEDVSPVIALRTAKGDDGDVLVEGQVCC
jgi:hypothetical protein